MSEQVDTTPRLRVTSPESIAAGLPIEYREAYLTAAAQTYANAAERQRLLEVAQAENVVVNAGSLATNNSTQDMQLAG